MKQKAPRQARPAALCCMVKGNRIKIKGLPLIRLCPSRPLPESKPLSMRLVMHGRKLTVDLVYQEDVVPLSESAAVVGIDMGVNERMTLSTGQTISRREVDRRRERNTKGYHTACRKAQTDLKSCCRRLGLDALPTYQQIIESALRLCERQSTRISNFQLFRVWPRWTLILLLTGAVILDCRGLMSKTVLNQFR